MKIAQIFIEELINQGVEYIFTIPGEETLQILEQIRLSGSIKLVLCRDELSAGFIAANYGRITGKPGIALTTLGPGATNITTAMAYAYLGGMPMVVISGQKPILEQNAENNLFQKVNLISLFDPISKATIQISKDSNINYIVEDMFDQATSGRPGPVYIEIPKDIAEIDAVVSSRTPIIRSTPKANSEDLEKIAVRLKLAKSPLLMLGAQGKTGLNPQVIEEFIEKYGIYFFTTQLGKGAISEDNPHFLGTLIQNQNDRLHPIIEESDLIISIGYDNYEKAPFKIENSKLHALPGDISESLKYLQVILDSKQKFDNSKFMQYKAEREIIEKNQKIESQSQNPTGKNEYFDMPTLISTLEDIYSKNTIFALDNGLYKLWMARQLKLGSGCSMLLDNSLATMGAGLSTGIAAALTSHDKSVVVVTGDGGFMMSMHELETAKRLGLNLTILLLDDSAYGMIAVEQAKYGYDRFGVDYGNPDFVKLAESFGIVGQKASDSLSLKNLLESQSIHKGIRLVHIPIKYSGFPKP